MRIWLSLYTLKTRNGSLRSGYLVKTQEDNQGPGYADIFPWPEFGDPPLEQIPAMISKGSLPPLLRRSLFFARRDALYRSQEKSLVRGIEFKNHYLLHSQPSQWIQDIEMAFARGFTSVKIKVGKSPRAEIQVLKDLPRIFPRSRWLRLDFNTQGNLDYFQQIHTIEPVVEFVEDPFPVPQDWARLAWPLAYDQPPFVAEAVEHRLRIIKPAKQPCSLLGSGFQGGRPTVYQKCGLAPPPHYVLTSYLDHPVGIAHAMVEAGFLGRQSLDYGLMSLDYYEPTDFHEYLVQNGPRLSAKGEYGIGFDSLWDRQDWESLC